MKNQKSEMYFLVILLLGVFILTYFIYKPFLYALILAIVFATIFEPIHKKILVMTKEKKGLSAVLATALILIIVIVPISFLSVQILHETTQFYSSLADSGVNDISSKVNDSIQEFAKFSHVPIEFSVDIEQSLKEGLNWLIQNIGPLFTNVAKIVVDIFIFLIALYYLFKDGHKLKETVITLSPLQDKYDETIFNKLETVINSAILGSLGVAVTQGILTAIGFFIFGVPNPFLWGSVAAVAALVPGIGTALVLLPAILYLYFNGETSSAVGFLVWGVFAVGLVDNFLGPKIAEKGMKIHPFLILLSTLGGIGYFGPLGFILGPLVLSMLFVLLEIYSLVSKKFERE